MTCLFAEQGAGYAERYHARGHATTAQEAEKLEKERQAGGRTYLESGTTGNAPVWRGKGAELLGLGRAFNRTSFMAAVNGKYEINGKYVDVNYKSTRKTTTVSKSGRQIGKEAYAFGEFVTSVNKSFSIGIGMATGADKALLKGIVDQAMNAAAEHMESLARVRVTENGVTRWERPVGIQYVNFDHMHNRRGDAHNHGHWAVMRHAMCADGKFRTLDMSIFMQAQHEIDAVMKTTLTRLCAEAGYALDMTTNGPELRLAPLALRRACSTGTKEIEEFLRQHGVNFDEASHDQKSWANAMTKLSKVEFSESHIDKITRDKFAAAGFDFDNFKAAPERAPYEIEPEITAREAIALALEECHERQDVIKSRYQLSFAAARYRGWAGQVSEITDEIDALIESGYLVFRGQGTGVASRAAGEMTSQFAIERERAAVELYKRGVGKGVAITSASVAQKAVLNIEHEIQRDTGNDAARLTAGQVEMIHSALLSTDRIIVCEGDPGTGKTTGMSAVKAAAEDAGWKVVGFAPSDQARDALTSSGVKSETVQFVTRSDAYWKQIDETTFIIIDEAGMVDAGEMRKVLQQAELAGARVQLVGDRKQLQSVGAGVAYAKIATYAKKQGKLVELTEMNRARTTANKSLHILSRDDQVKALQQLMHPEVMNGDKARLRAELHDGVAAIVADVIAADGRVRASIALKPDTSLSRLPRGELLTVSGMKHDAFSLSAENGEPIEAVMADGGPAGKVWSNSSAAARYDYLARSYTALDSETQFRTPIIVDTNEDLAGVTAAIRAKRGIESVFEVKTFESLNYEIARHMTSTSYEVGSCIRITQSGEGFTKGQLLTVSSVERDRLHVRDERGSQRIFVPSRDGSRATLGEIESCNLGVGDFVRFTAKWASVGIRNGDRGIIREIDEKGKATVDIVDWDGKKRATKELDLSKGPVGLRAGYAATVHAVQGGTMNRGYYLASSTSRNSFLVGLTRFRYGCTLVADLGTRQAAEALMIRVQTHQHKKPALPSREDFAQQKRRPVVNAAWPADKTQLTGADGRIRFAAFPANAELSERNMRTFLREAKVMSGATVLVNGNDRFVKLARQVAANEPELGVTVVTLGQKSLALAVSQDPKTPASPPTLMANSSAQSPLAPTASPELPVVEVNRRSTSRGRSM